MTTTSATADSRVATPAGIDPRGPRVTAALTAVVLLAVLVLPTAAATVLVAVQAGLFALGAVRGMQHTPTAWLFRRVVRPRLAPPAYLEDARPPRFAQAVGLVFAVLALVGFLAGVPALALGATGLALVAALLNAVFGFCLGCEMYLLLKRLTPRTA